ncbi:hypothetical protein EGW08_023215, partial [Elysia chlorotica]
YASILGVMGFSPETIDIDLANKLYDNLLKTNKITLVNKYKINFDPTKDVVFNNKVFLPEHPNGMILRLYNGDTPLVSEKYFSIGGGFIKNENNIKNGSDNDSNTTIKKPYEFSSAKELFDMCAKNNLTIADVMYENEKTAYTESEILAKIMEIWEVMDTSITKGLESDQAILDGGLGTRRRAPKLYKKLVNSNIASSDYNYLNIYAMAVNEQNASGGKVVTAPTNGAAGIVPAVFKYYLVSNNITDTKEIEKLATKYFLTNAAIGLLYKSRASISGAEVGCQGEVGVACSMAAAGYCSLIGGDNESVETAAEIAMEHNLGLTCYPVGGLVQVPCIERNAMAAVQSINAAKLAYLDSGEKHIVGLDSVIDTMYQTGLDMNSKYRETSLGGLAVSVPLC